MKNQFSWPFSLQAGRGRRLNRDWLLDGLLMALLALNCYSFFFLKGWLLEGLAILLGAIVVWVFCWAEKPWRSYLANWLGFSIGGTVAFLAFSSLRFSLGYQEPGWREPPLFILLWWVVWLIIIATGYLTGRFLRWVWGLFLE